jgi:hypothetical protein
MQVFIFTLFLALTINVSAFETKDAIKKDFKELKNKTIPEKAAKIKKKISAVSDKINSKIHEKLGD